MGIWDMKFSKENLKLLTPSFEARRSHHCVLMAIAYQEVGDQN